MAPYGGETTTAPEEPDEPAPKVKLPGHKERLSWYDDWEEQQRQNRKEAQTDRDYYDGKQWSKTELDELRKRGQPPTVNNRVAKKVNTLLGEEIEKRTDPVAKPRTQGHGNDSRAATDALRYVADEQEMPRVKSAVAKDFFIEGIGCAVKRVTAEGKHELHHVPYDRFGYDIHSRDVLFRDARRLWVLTWLDFDEAEELFPGAEDMLKSASAQWGESTDDTPRDWIDRGGERVMVMECYFEVGGSWYVAFDTRCGELQEAEPTAYYREDEQGNRSTVCPVKAASCYVDKDGNRYGVVRNLRSPQDRINKFESKTQHLLNSDQVWGEEGAVASPEELRDEKAKPDGMYFGFAPGALQNGSVQFQKHIEIATGFVQLAQQAVANIDGIGPSASNLPELPAAASGRAQMMRRKAAALDYGTIFDHLSWWAKSVYELDWLCIRQVWTEEKWLRVTDDKERTGYRFVGLNQRMTMAQRFAELLKSEPPVPVPSALETAAGANIAAAVLYGVQQQVQQISMHAQATGQQPPPPDQLLPQLIQAHPLMQGMVTVNNVAQMLVDIVLDEAPDTAVLAEEQFQTLSEITGPVSQARPDLAPVMAKALVQASSLPDKRDILEGFDKAPDPKQAQMQQAMQQLQMKMAELEAGLKQAQIQKTQADAQLSQARAVSEQAQLGQMPGQQGPTPLEQAKTEREMVGTRLDVEKTRAQIEKDRAATAKSVAGAAAQARSAMEPGVIAVEMGP